MCTAHPFFTIVMLDYQSTIGNSKDVTCVFILILEMAKLVFDQESILVGNVQRRTAPSVLHCQLLSGVEKQRP